MSDGHGTGANFSNVALTEKLDEIDLKESLRMQLAECEMLQSMFPDAEEFSLDAGILVDVEDYTEGRTQVKPPQINYTINLTVADFKLEVCANLPLEYPNVEPEIFVRSDKLSRQQQRTLNANLLGFVSELNRDEIIIGSVIAWLQENAVDYFSQDGTDHDTRETHKSEEKESIFTRYWIYSHHIYSKVKRKVMLDLADEYLLTGFCLPGKPGIICLEGYESDCEKWWQQVKGMTWKKIMCIKKEENKTDLNIDEQRRFTGFQEISFNSGKVKKQDHHMDFGEFYQYLKENKCEYMFKLYFGVDGK